MLQILLKQNLVNMWENFLLLYLSCDNFCSFANVFFEKPNQIDGSVNLLNRFKLVTLERYQITANEVKAKNTTNKI